MKQQIHTAPKPIINDRALQCSASIRPFIGNVGGYVDEVIENHAKDIQKAMETYWPQMKAENESLESINKELLEALENFVQANAMQNSNILLVKIGQDLIKKAKL